MSNSLFPAHYIMDIISPLLTLYQGTGLLLVTPCPSVSMISLYLQCYV